MGGRPQHQKVKHVRAWTIDDWNKIIAGVNGVVSGCNNGSNPSPLQPVTAPHIWTVKDVQAVRDALSGACSNASFSAPLTVWSQAIIDELNAMLGGNCQCEPAAAVTIAVTIATAGLRLLVHCRLSMQRDRNQLCYVG